jgi:hypothetical protein
MNARTIRTFTSAVAMGIVAVGSNSAIAQVSGAPTALLAASLEEKVVHNSTTDSSEGNYQTVNNGYATATASFTGDDGSASISIKPGNTGFQLAEATVSWSFYIAGPPAMMVPIVVIGHGELMVSGAEPGTLIDEAKFYGTLPSFLYDEIASSNVRNIFNVAYPGYIPDNIVYDISFEADAQSFGGTSPSITALADPAVEFASGFNSTGFSIVSSPVISAVPEVSTSWLLLSGGLGLIGLRKVFPSRRLFDPVAPYGAVEHP